VAVLRRHLRERRRAQLPPAGATIFVGSSNELGAFESGVAARLLGTVQAVVLGGLASLGVVAATAARVPQLRQLKRIG
jgi:hypothetical protein